MITNFDTKFKAWFLRSSSAQVTLPTEAWGYWNQWHTIGIQSETWGVSITNYYLHMFNKCHLIWKWTTQKTIFQHNSCIGIYMKYLQVDRRKIKRWSIHWGMQSSIGNTWVPLKIICILDYCKTKVCLIGVVPSMGLLLFHADVSNCWSLGTYLYKWRILRWGKWSMLCRRWNWS